ncbi:MAG: B12-binding domain-containing radical SAM protein, partial [Acidobacteriales bacterium]|nr:B12-binding domain-containing radical SAM protein [Terriglobales bacterium]
MKIHLVNPSDVSFGTAVITPRWQYVLAGATPDAYGEPVLVDETIEPLRPESIQRGDVVGIGIHTANALRGYGIGKMARDRGAYVIYGGIHATLFPEEAIELGAAHAVVKGDGDVVWPQVLADCRDSTPKPVYVGGRIEASAFVPARWDLVPRNRYMWASVQTVRGCPKHCSFCSVWRTDGQRPRQRSSDAVIEEVVQLRRLGFRFIALADDNFYPVTLTDLNLATQQQNIVRLSELKAIRAERFELMSRLAMLPDDMVFFTQITMEAAEDVEFLKAMKKARIKGALVGVESVTPEGLKDVYKGFNLSGDSLIQQLRTFRQNGVHVLGSFIFGLPSDRPETFAATAAAAQKADVTFAQFVTLSPYPGTVDFNRWEKTLGPNPPTIAGIPLTRRWLIPQGLRPKLYWDHPSMSAEEI